MTMVIGKGPEKLFMSTSSSMALIICHTELIAPDECRLKQPEGCGSIELLLSEQDTLFTH